MRGGLIVTAAALTIGVVLLLWHGEIKGARGARTRDPRTAGDGGETKASPTLPEKPEPHETGQMPPPQEEVAWLTELPAAYRGDVVVRGIVINERGEPVSDAQVMCRPFRWVPFAEPHFAALTRRTDSRGSFAFESLPAVPIYEIAVLSEQGYASDRYPRDRAIAAPLQIRISPAYYERIGFYDEDGKPLDVSQVLLQLGRGGFLFASDGPPPPIWLSRWFAAVGHPLVWEPHEAVYVYPASAPYARDAENDLPATMRTIHPHGYGVVDVPEQRAPLSEWPKPTGRVALRKEPLAEGKRRYRCILPDVDPPRWWGVPDAYQRFSLKVGIGPEEPQQWFMPMRGREEFVGPAPDKIAVMLNGVIPLPFTVSEEGDVVVLKPELGRYGYLSVHYPASRGDRPGVGTLLFVAPDDGKSLPLAGNFMWPGFERFGPLPVGHYTISVRWADTAAPLHEQPIRVEVHEGWEKVDAR